jgi:hypothetical protein
MAVYTDPERYDIYAGDAWSQDFEFGELADPTDPSSAWTADDLSGFSGWEAHWRVSDDATEPIVLTVDASQAAAGILTVSATEEQTREMGEAGVFDIQATLPRVRTFLRARTRWTLDVTRG